MVYSILNLTALLYLIKFERDEDGINSDKIFQS